VTFNLSIAFFLCFVLSLYTAALPFISDALAFYRDWVVERPDGRGGTMLVDWVDCHDEEDMMQINVSDGGKKWVPGCLQANLLFANAMIRRLSAALPRYGTTLSVYLLRTIRPYAIVISQPENIESD
jgi:hypothetical protein